MSADETHARRHSLIDRGVLYFSLSASVSRCASLWSLCVVWACIILRVDLLIFADGFFFNNGPSGCYHQRSWFQVEWLHLGSTLACVCMTWLCGFDVPLFSDPFESWLGMWCACEMRVAKDPWIWVDPQPTFSRVPLKWGAFMATSGKLYGWSRIKKPQ